MDVPVGMKKRAVDYEGRLYRLVQYIFKNNSMEFFGGYLWNGKYGNDFVRQINVDCGNAASWVLKEEALSDRTKRKYVLQTILQWEAYCSEDPEDLRHIAEYAGQTPQLLYEASMEDERERFIAGVEHFGVKFSRLQLTEEEAALEEDALEETALEEAALEKGPDKDMDLIIYDSLLWQQIYYRWLYVINWENLSFIFQDLYKLPLEEIRRSRMLTLVYEKGEEPLRLYVEENLETVLEELAAWGEPLEDEEKIILSVLNREDLSRESREKYIGTLACRREISQLSQVENKDFWPGLMEGHVAAEPHNLTDYYFLSGNGMDEVLADYINRYPGPITLSEKELDNAYGEGTMKLLQMEIIRCNFLRKEKYNELVKSFSLTCDTADVGDVGEDKMRILIFWKKISMTQENLQYIREHYPKLAPVFAGRNVSEYLSLSHTDGETWEEEFLSVLVSDREAFSAFINSEEESPERKKKALAKSVNRNMLKLSELQRYLENLEQRDFLDLLNGSRIILEQTPGNEALLDAFQKRNWIVGFEVDQQDDSLYRAQGKAVLGRKRKKR